MKLKMFKWLPAVFAVLALIVVFVFRGDYMGILLFLLLIVAAGVSYGWRGKGSEHE